jgi:tRNA threonylcarbamoyladenosine biosynthesis protein TsaB
MILIINTANEKYLEVILADSKDNFKIEKVEGNRKQAEQLLSTIKDVLSDLDKEVSDITGIGVVSGPGGFTALRIGVTTANVLAHALHIPVVGLTLADFSDNNDLVSMVFDKLEKTEAGEIVMPEYGKEPNIT